MKILITGAGKGIGLAEAIKFRSDDLYLVGRSDIKIEGLGLSGHYFRHDLSTLDGIQACVKAVTAQTDNVDVLINNVGLMVLKKFEDMDEQDIGRVLDTNLRAHMLLTKGLLPLLKAAEHPHIVFMSSMAAKSSIIGESVYAATKAAITNFANVLRNEFTGRIKISTIHAWGVNTWGAKDAERLLRPEDVAEAVEFIVSRGPNFLVESIDLGNIHQWRGGQAPWSPQ